MKEEQPTRSELVKPVITRATRDIVALEAELEQVRQERDEFKKIRDAVVKFTAMGAGASEDAVMESPVKFVRSMKDRAEAAEQSRERMREALEKAERIVDGLDAYCGTDGREPYEGDDCPHEFIGLELIRTFRLEARKALEGER